MRVKLVHDYSKYNSRLEKGLEGVALETPEEQLESRPFDNFVKVKFEGITEVDVLWRGLEIVDEGYLAKKEAEKEAYFSQIATAKNVIVTLGPKEGFKSIELDYTNNQGDTVHLLIDDKAESQDYFKTFEKYGVAYVTVKLEGKKVGRKAKEGE